MADETRERYTMGYGAAASGMATRNANEQAAFLLPHLKSGMDLLDCGCGPGTITAGLARIVNPGRVVGIDIESSQVEKAQNNAKEQNLTNTRFEVGNIYNLDFPDESFDVVFANGVIEHLSNPVKAFREIHRVLKPGGVVGVRSPAIPPIIEPPDPWLDEFLKVFFAISKRNGSNLEVGKQLHVLAREAEFIRIVPSASFDYRSHATPESLAIFRDKAIEVITSQALEYGLADQLALDNMADAWKRWGGHPDAFMARGWGETLAWK